MGKKPAFVIVMVLSFLIISPVTGMSVKSGPEVIIVSMEPQHYIMDQLLKGIDGYNVRAIVKEGMDPHTVSLSSKQIFQLQGAEIYFTLGLPIERRFITMFANSAAHRLVYLNRGAGEHVEDVHTWLDPLQLKKHAEKMMQSMCQFSRSDSEMIRQNGENLLKRIDSLQDKLRSALSPYTNGILFSFHSAFGHFARRFNLREISLEREEHTPSAKQVARFITTVRKYGGKILFITPSTNRQFAMTISSAIDCDLEVIDPNAYDILSELDRLGMLSVRSLSKEAK